MNTENTLKSSNIQQTINIGELCFVYAKAKWMKSFKAFDLDGCFPGKLIFASMLDDSEENREKLQKLADHNRGQGIQFQLRKGNKILFETKLS